MFFFWIPSTDYDNPTFFWGSINPRTNHEPMGFAHCSNGGSCFVMLYRSVSRRIKNGEVNSWVSKTWSVSGQKNGTQQTMQKPWKKNVHPGLTWWCMGKQWNISKKPLNCQACHLAQVKNNSFGSQRLPSGNTVMDNQVSIKAKHCNSSLTLW